MSIQPHSPTRSRSVLFAGIREQLRERRQAAASHRRLQHDLAAYRTPAEVNDLLAAVDRQGDDSPQAEQIRRILAQNLAAYRRGY